MNQASIYARDLQPGMTIPMRDGVATVKSVTWMDGQDGRPSLLVGYIQPTCAALRIEFIDHEAVIAHPRALVVPSMKERH